MKSRVFFALRNPVRFICIRFGLHTVFFSTCSSRMLKTYLREVGGCGVRGGEVSAGWGCSPFGMRKLCDGNDRKRGDEMQGREAGRETDSMTTSSSNPKMVVIWNEPRSVAEYGVSAG
jgi:hypothetical protein